MTKADEKYDLTKLPFMLAMFFKTSIYETKIATDRVAIIPCLQSANHS